MYFSDFIYMNSFMQIAFGMFNDLYGSIINYLFQYYILCYMKLNQIYGTAHNKFNKIAKTVIASVPITKQYTVT